MSIFLICARILLTKVVSTSGQSTNVASGSFRRDRVQEGEHRTWGRRLRKKKYTSVGVDPVDRWSDCPKKGAERSYASSLGPACYFGGGPRRGRLGRRRPRAPAPACAACRVAAAERNRPRARRAHGRPTPAPRRRHAARPDSRRLMVTAPPCCD